MKDWIIPVSVIALLEGLRALNQTLAFVVAALVLGYCLGRLSVAANAPSPGAT